jgi:hypothetical protein
MRRKEEERDRELNEKEGEK